jgi:hypothetical protein
MHLIETLEITDVNEHIGVESNTLTIYIALCTPTIYLQ